MQEERMPLFLINGFLEAGKTEFIKFTMEQEYFKDRGKNPSHCLRGKARRSTRKNF